MLQIVYSGRHRTVHGRSDLVLVHQHPLWPYVVPQESHFVCEELTFSFFYLDFIFEKHLSDILHVCSFVR